MLKADSFNFLFFFPLPFFPFLVRARHIPPFCAVHLQRSAPTLLRARFSVLRAKRAPRGLTAHQTLALTLDRSPFGRVFFDSAGSTSFHALPVRLLDSIHPARGSWSESCPVLTFNKTREIIITIRRGGAAADNAGAEVGALRREIRVSTSARCTGRESRRERAREREREGEALDLGTVLRVRYHSHTRE